MTIRILASRPVRHHLARRFHRRGRGRLRCRAGGAGLHQPGQLPAQLRHRRFAASKVDAGDTASADELRARGAVNVLISPNEMGELFKVIALGAACRARCSASPAATACMPCKIGTNEGAINMQERLTRGPGLRGAGGGCGDINVKKYLPSAATRCRSVRARRPMPRNTSVPPASGFTSARWRAAGGLADPAGARAAARPDRRQFDALRQGQHRAGPQRQRWRRSSRRHRRFPMPTARPAAASRRRQASKHGPGGKPHHGRDNTAGEPRMTDGTRAQHRHRPPQGAGGPAAPSRRAGCGAKGARRSRAPWRPARRSRRAGRALRACSPCRARAPSMPKPA
jgi:hypothetical protein